MLFALGVCCISLLATIHLSCKKDDILVPPSVSKMDNGVGDVGPSGGSVSLPDGAAVTIPSGALASPRNISIVRITSDIVANTGCRVYEFSPNGLSFSDSVTLTLPFDYQSIPSGLASKDLRVRVMVEEDDEWKFLSTAFDVATGKATVKTKHFSKYVVSSSGQWSKYFQQHKGDAETYNQVPYYAQGESGWCVFYSTSMAARFCGYDLKGYTLAALMNKKIDQGLRLNTSEWAAFDTKLNGLGVKTERATPPWGNSLELCGYVISKLDAGDIVVINSNTLSHAFVVCGHNSTGFFVNDPSGVFLEVALGTTPSESEREMVLVSYEMFRKALDEKFLDWLHLGGPEGTLSIRGTSGLPQNVGPTLNIPGDRSVVYVLNSGQSEIAHLEFQGTFQPTGYAFTHNGQILSVLAQPFYFEVHPDVASSDQYQTLGTEIQYKIDGAEISARQFMSLPKGELVSTFPRQFLVSGLGLGTHKLTIELHSSVSPPSLFDSFSFDFTVSAMPNSPPAVPSSPSPANAATSVSISPTLSWTCSDSDGDVLSYDVFFSTSNPPTTQVATAQVGTILPRAGLANSRTYYWKVNVKDSKGAGTSGTVWSFTTVSVANNPPAVPSSPTPANAAMEISTSPTLSWTCSDPDGDVLTYDVYFGTSNPPTNQVATGQSVASLSRSGLSNSTTYHWKVVAKDNKGASTSGSVWSFTTGAGGNTGGMVLVQGGTFQMGRADGNPSELPVHAVTLSSYYLDAKEVTVAQYRAFANATGRTMPTEPSWGWLDDNPIVNVSWDDATAYAARAGKRLPTEAEWEYAARGGPQTHGYIFSGSSSIGAVAWYGDNSGGRTHSVGTKTSNELGLYDMSGNAWEWCSDWFSESYYSESLSINPQGPSTGTNRALRGSSWFDVEDGCRVTYRGTLLPSTIDTYYGFRCAKSY
jgi:formylglycine-generating enzyme required for sulfatase activity